jgi:hypothetical protein
MNDEWLKENYDKAALIAAAVIAVVLAGWLIFSSMSFAENFATEGTRRSDELPDLKMDALEAGKESLTTAERFTGERLFASIPVLEVAAGDETALRPVTRDSEPIHPPITNAWILDNSLNIADPNLPERDPDGDRFTNLEEFLADPKTDPNNIENYPPFIAKLCLQEMVSSDLFLTYKGSVDGRNQQIEQSSPDGRYQDRQLLKQVGDRFGPNDMFRLAQQTPKSQINEQGVREDISEIVISYRPPGETELAQVTLVQGVEWEMPTGTGNFLNRYNNESMEIKRGESFKLSNDLDNSFTLKEVSADGATVIDSEGKEIQIHPCP